MSAPAIQVEKLSKEYRLGIIGHDTLYRDLQSWWARVRGKQDPNAPIFDAHRKHADRFWAIKDISLEIPVGQRLGIIGRNGAGKSTLLKILSRLTAPTSGEVRIRGRFASLLEVGTGFHPELTGRENVFLNGAIMGMKKKDVARKFDEIVSFAGVEQYIDTPVKRYSSGMHVRLGFAVAAHLDPDILIVDEVLAVGDAEFQRKCLGKLGSNAAAGDRTVLFVSHNMASIIQLCDQCVWIDEGQVAGFGKTEAVVAQYLGTRDERMAETANGIKADPAKVFQYTDFFVQDGHGHRRTEFSCEEEIHLCMQIRVASALAGAYGRIFITNQMDEYVWEGDSRDWKDDLQHLDSGTYSVRVTLPARVLGHGTYFIRISAANKNTNTSLHHIPNVGTLTVSDPGVRGSSRTGVISALMRWKAEKIG